MHRTVRYYITESDDQPIVRTVPVATVRQPASNRSNDPQRNSTDELSQEEKSRRGRMKLPAPLRRVR
jgi:hypothetical protein